MQSTVLSLILAKNVEEANDTLESSKETTVQTGCQVRPRSCNDLNPEHIGIKIKAFLKDTFIEGSCVHRKDDNKYNPFRRDHKGLLERGVGH